MNLRGTVARVGAIVVALIMDLAFWGGSTVLRSGAQVPVAVVVGSALAVCAALWLRRRRPGLIYGLAWIYTVAWGLLLPTYQSFTVLLFALHAFARYVPLVRAWPFLLATVVPWAINTGNGARGTGTDLIGAAGIAAVWGVITAAVWLTGRFGFQADRTAQALEHQAAAEAVLARQDERLRLARELHDVVAHSVTAIALQAAGIRQAVPDQPPAVLATLQTIEGAATGAIRELRVLLGFLRASDDDGDLATLVATTRACGVIVDVAVVGADRPLAPAVRQVRYRVVQEALANVIRHGGTGAQAAVKLVWGADELLITVRNPIGAGRGELTDLGPHGFGLTGLRERLAAVGGRLSTGRECEEFRLTAVLPAPGPAVRPRTG